MKPTTETIAFRMRLHAGQAEDYRRRHDEIWPELAQELRARGVVDYRIFLDPETHVLFAVMVRRLDHDLDGLPQTALMKRWWAMMGDIMETNPDQSPVQVDLPQMFALTAT